MKHNSRTCPSNLSASLEGLAGCMNIFKEPKVVKSKKVNKPLEGLAGCMNIFKEPKVVQIKKVNKSLEGLAPLATPEPRGLVAGGRIGGEDPDLALKEFFEVSDPLSFDPLSFDPRETNKGKKKILKGCRIINKNMQSIIDDDTLLKLTERTCKLISGKQSELSDVKWTDGESNTDTEFSMLACEACKEAFGEMKSEGIIDQKITVECRHPDINCVFSSDEGKSEKKIELKSCKGRKIIGSCIGKLDINQPLIYCLRPNIEGEKYEIRYSQYHQALIPSEYDSFNDRTPRPPLSFDDMKEPDSGYQSFCEKEKGDWITGYAESAINRLNNPKYETWQEKLVGAIKSIIVKKFIEETSVEEFIKLKG